MTATNIRLDQDIIVSVIGERQKKGFIGSEYLIEFAVAVPVHIVGGLLAHTLYDWLKSRRALSGRLTFKEVNLNLEDPDTEVKLAKTLEETLETESIPDKSDKE